MFFCALRPTGESLAKSDLFGSIARLRRHVDGPFDFLLAGPFAAAARTGPDALRPMLARFHNLVGAGDCRLDNRAELNATLRKPPSANASDLEVALAVIDAGGETAIASLHGDFGFAVWDASAQKLLLVRDAFGVRSLFYRHGDGLVSISSGIEPLQSNERPDLDHIADFLLGMHSMGERTIWSDVKAVPAACYVRQQGTVCQTRRYWDPAAFDADESMRDDEAVATFSKLLAQAVVSRFDTNGATWAHLSGGLDSSSIVALASELGGLAGTLTGVDTLGEGDERKYSNVVAERCGVRNEEVCDYWAWQNDGMDAPLTDEPQPLYPFYARDRRLHEVVRSSGARVVLGGLGSDHYLAGTLDYLTDIAARGNVARATRETAQWAIKLRTSFWRLAKRQLVQPFLPGVMQPPTPLMSVPGWLSPDFAGRRQLGQRLPTAHARRGRPGHRLKTHTLNNLRSLPAWVDRWPWGTDAEMRYPFLDRRLVEAALRMPMSAQIRPGVQKWVLRESMRNTLPDTVRERAGKGGIDARILWSMEKERPLIDHLLQDPVLADLGVIEPIRIREAVDKARRGIRTNNVLLMSTLSLETWFSTRAGRLAQQHAAISAA